MATRENTSAITLVAGADLSEQQFRFVVVNAAGKAVVAGAGAAAVGVLTNDPLEDQAGTVDIGGVTKVVAGATVAAGARVESNAAGAAITLDSGEALGTALSGGAAGENISVLL